MIDLSDKWILVTLSSLLLILFAMMFATPLWDIDSWWHLSTGKYIVEHKSLITFDPFSYTSEHIQPDRRIILNGYWLAQIIYYMAHYMFMNSGLIAFRVILLLLSLISIIIISQKLGAGNPSILILVTLSGFVTLYFTAARPQLFSFVFTPIVLFLLEDARRKYRASKLHIGSYILLPAIMLIWANLHGGFMMGTAIIILFGITETAVFAYEKHTQKRYFLQFCMILAIAVFASLINPNTYKTYLLLFQFEGSILQERTSEYMSPLLLITKHNFFIASYWIYLATAVLVVALTIKKIEKPHLVIIIFLAAISLYALRYIPFFIYATSPFIAYYLTRYAEERRGVKILLNVLVPIAVAMTIFFSIYQFEGSLGKTLRSQVNDRRFPVNAVSFIDEISPRGNIFNYFNWGGYLIWKLYPKYKVFIDGRTLSMKAFNDYTYILWDRDRGKRLLDYHKINMVIIPEYDLFTHEQFNLIRFLTMDKEWHPVYRDELATIFLRGEANRNIIEKYRK